MTDHTEYDIFETHTGWGVKLRTTTPTPTGTNQMTTLHSEHATKEQAQAEADRLNAN